jgi:diacylglycerol kinase family enzyme
MSLPAEAATPRPVALVLNPKSGDGKVARFRLVEVAELLGARVLLTGPGQDAAALARRALADGAEVLGVAGGDGTVSTVAAVAAEAGRPLVVVPAGTRNHFARDLGLDIHDPATAVQALRDGEPVRVDLGFVAGRPFVNNVSFGVYADALLSPGYREAKTRALASTAGPYIQGRQWVDAGVDTPEGTIERPQVVLISNNPYHIATPRYLGRRFALDRGALGVIVVKRSAGSAPEPLPRLVRDLAERGATSGGEGLITWSADRVTLHGAASTVATVSTVAAGVDGEAVTLPLPLTCEIRPGALRVLLPKDRPGVPDEPRPPRRPGQGADAG